MQNARLSGAWTSEEYTETSGPGSSSGSTKRSKDNRKAVGNPSDISTLEILLCPEDGDRAFLRNVGKHQPEYTASSMNTVFFRVTAVRTSNLTSSDLYFYTQHNTYVWKGRNKQQNQGSE
jgi:hypothetical protein